MAKKKLTEEQIDDKENLAEFLDSPVSDVKRNEWQTIGQVVVNGARLCLGSPRIMISLDCEEGSLFQRSKEYDKTYNVDAKFKGKTKRIQEIRIRFAKAEAAAAKA